VRFLRRLEYFVILAFGVDLKGMMELNKIYNMDCMVGMGKFPDKYFDLAIVDPPYGLGVASVSAWGGGGEFGKGKYNPISKKAVKIKRYEIKEWDVAIPNTNYFRELIRVSKHQIIWGGNYFADMLNASSCWIVWDKENGKSNFADCELAWTNFNTAVRKFRWRWHGCLQHDMKNKEARIHPTQKPLQLYKWTLKKYAQAGWKILDTHGGSGVTAVACEWLGFDYCVFEVNKEYWAGANARL